MPVLLQDFHQLVLIQRAAERGLLVLDLRAQVFPQLLEDVVLLPDGQISPNRLQVTLEKIHTVLLNNKFDGAQAKKGSTVANMRAALSNGRTRLLLASIASAATAELRTTRVRR